MSNVEISKGKAWVLASRLRTLPAAIAPVLIGLALSYKDGFMDWPIALVTMLGAIFIQIGTNFANDYFDFVNGTDTEERVGPVRVTQAGILKPSEVKMGFILTFVLSAVCGAYLIYHGGMPIVIIGIFSIACGILYTAGPKPLGYIGLGDILVLIFFGPVAVNGTYYLQSGTINTATIIASLAPGFLSTAILTVNNLRDRETDSKTGKGTLAVRLGVKFTQMEYLFCGIVAAVVPVALYYIDSKYMMTMIALIPLLLIIPLTIKMFTVYESSFYNSALANTGKVLFIYSIFFSVGLLV